MFLIKISSDIHALSAGDGRIENRVTRCTKHVAIFTANFATLLGQAKTQVINTADNIDNDLNDVLRKQLREAKQNDAMIN